MRSNLIFRVVLLFCLTHSLPVLATHGNLIDHLVHDEAYLQLFWDSHYVSEGRDNLDGGSMQTSVLSLKYDYFELMIWNGWGYDSDYNELNIVPALNFEYESLSFYLSYNRLQFTEQGLFDNEIGAGVSYNGLAENVYLDVDWYHSFGSAGSFFEFSLVHVYEIKNSLRLESRATLGMNENYIPDGHDGLNHAAVWITAEYRLLDNLNLHSLLAYNHAFDRQENIYAGDELLRDFAWGRIGFEFLF